MKTLLDTPFCKDSLLLAARLLIALLFLMFGPGKLMHFSGTVGYMQHVGAPLPFAAAIVAVLMEVPVALAIAFGLFTRPLVLLLALYTLGAALLGHPYWSNSGAERHINEINFYKNIAIIGGLLALYAAGPGRYALDRRLIGTAATSR